jgi:multiple sugar transport system permease protein
MQISIIGFYHYMSMLGLTDNYLALILPSIGSAGAVFFSLQYLESMAVQDLIDSARIDGATELGIFHQIMIPLAVPGMATLGIFSFVASWNNFFTPFILITTKSKYTLPMLVKTMEGDVYRTEYGAIYLGLAMTIVPILVIYAIFSRYIVSGIAMGAIKE